MATNTPASLLLCLALASAASVSAQTSPRIAPSAPDRSAPASAPSNEGADISDKLQVAAPDAVDRSVRKLSGHTVYGPKGEKLGVIKDFVIEKQTGRVVYAVISSGGIAGLGDTLRLIPIHALLSAPFGATGFSVRVSQADWQRTPALIDEAFDKGLIVVSADHRKLHDEIFGPAPAGARATPPAPLPLDREAALAASPWIRASHLRGKSLTSSGEKLGAIDDIVIDLRRGAAIALVDLDDTLLAADQRALIPLTELTLNQPPAAGALATNYTRNDFAQLDAAARQRAEANVLPTGRSAPAATSPQSSEATLASAVRSARQALDNHAELARADIHVTPENGMLILRGRVRTEQLKSQAESAVKDAASGIRLQNYLIVDPR